MIRASKRSIVCCMARDSTALERSVYPRVRKSTETWHAKRVSYTTNKNRKIFLKYSLTAFLEARTHFGPNRAIFHFWPKFCNIQDLTVLNLNTLAKSFIRHLFYSSLVIKACKVCGCARSAQKVNLAKQELCLHNEHFVIPTEMMP